MHRNVLKRRAQGMTLDDDHAKANGENPVSLIDFFLLAYWDMKSDLRTYRKDENLGHKHAFDDLTDKENPDCEWMYCFHWFGPDVQLVFQSDMSIDEDTFQIIQMAKSYKTYK